MLRRSALALCLLAVVGTARARAADAPPRQTMELWPGQAPGDQAPIGEEKATRNKEGTHHRAN